MKTVIHKATERGYANHGWLQANHYFSFANYFDPQRIHFGALRVLNDDLIAPGMGFGTHPHKNMEIITIPLKGVLKHRDSMQNAWQQVVPGEVQVMSAGRGVEHSEINGSSVEYLSLFQIWILPDKENIEPRYDQRKFELAPPNVLQTLVSSFTHSDVHSLKIHQNASIARLRLDEGAEFKYELQTKDHGVYIVVVEGDLNVASHQLESRDAIGVYDTEQLLLKATTHTEVLLIEVPMIKL